MGANEGVYIKRLFKPEERALLYIETGNFQQLMTDPRLNDLIPLIDHKSLSLNTCLDFMKVMQGKIPSDFDNSLNFMQRFDLQDLKPYEKPRCLV